MFGAYPAFFKKKEQATPTGELQARPSIRRALKLPVYVRNQAPGHALTGAYGASRQCAERCVGHGEERSLTYGARSGAVVRQRYAPPRALLRVQLCRIACQRLIVVMQFLRERVQACAIAGKYRSDNGHKLVPQLIAQIVALGIGRVMIKRQRMLAKVGLKLSPSQGKEGPPYVAIFLPHALQAGAARA
jgi:hypothetical protein